MTTRNYLDRELFRIRVLAIGITITLMILTVMIWRVQVKQGWQYENNLKKQCFRRVRLPGARGTIVDRNGACLAENKPEYCLVLYLEELRQPGSWSNTIRRTEGVVKKISQELNWEPQLTTDDIKVHIRRRLPLPMVAWRGMDEEKMAMWAERIGELPGVDISLEAARFYPQGKVACHVLGYVGKAAPPDEETEEPYHYYVPEMEGKSGIEKSFDEILRGEAGGRIVRVDVSGYRFDDLGMREPKAGQDVMLTLDVQMQKHVEHVLENVRGSAVVLDPNTGEVLAMASSPGFDPNDFVPLITKEKWESISQDKGRPLLNRAVAGAYAPGSIFKLVTAMAALAENKISKDTTFNCPGHLDLGAVRFRCAAQFGHGEINLERAIEGSCNVYFFHTGLQCGIKPIVSLARELGLGRKTGIELDYETAGQVPDEEWKQRCLKDGWRDGDTCNLSIGQGFLMVTPLQMAVLTAAIANGGTVYKPRLVLGIRRREGGEFERCPPVIANKIAWNTGHLGVVREGMRRVVMAEHGSGRLARIPSVEMAGKTGTAEYGKKGSGYKYGWMVAYAPYDKPRYVVALVVDEAESGAVTTGPLVKELMAGLFNNGNGAGGDSDEG